MDRRGFLKALFGAGVAALTNPAAILDVFAKPKVAVGKWMSFGSILEKGLRTEFAEVYVLKYEDIKTSIGGVVYLDDAPFMRKVGK